MSLTEEECTQKWTFLTEKLAEIDILIKDLTKTHQKSTEMESIEVAKLHQSAAFVMTELEKCNKKGNLRVVYIYHLSV